MGLREQENQNTSCTMFAWAAISKKTLSEKKRKRYHLPLSLNAEKKGMELFEKEENVSSSVMEYDAHFQDTPEKVDLKCDEIMEDIFAADRVTDPSQKTHKAIHEKIPEEMDKTTWQGKNAPKKALQIMKGKDAPCLARQRPKPIRV